MAPLAIDPTDHDDGVTGRRFTGWHVLACFAAFFFIVFAANGALVYMAVSTFSGVEVASSFKAGQEFPEELAQARAQAGRDWHVDVRPVLGADGRLELTAQFADHDGAALYGLEVTALLGHLADRRLDLTLVLEPVGGGRYAASAEQVPAGARELVIEAHRGGARQFLSRGKLFLKADGG
ncbi:FixH family protein [Methylobrevis pamukkalensis]|uniref:FixH n=1 Tax=Methylobrevis pamukkalensis TaxID=1439726 RepID=A0A1E3H7P1_9HYPH|nr:FixH family protein [Methylobrevis pamukkalensis]ODN72359.1 FixH [Methylobrevis pamukkalensis]